MKTKLFFALLSFIAFLTGPAFARSSVPIVNIENVTITTGSGKAPAAEQVKQSIIQAGGAHGWQITPGADGKLIGTIVVRNKHTVVIDIPYTATQYSLLYKSSINMNYEASGNAPVIHPNYNKWVETLNNDIRLELLKL